MIQDRHNIPFFEDDFDDFLGDVRKAKQRPPQTHRFVFDHSRPPFPDQKKVSVLAKELPLRIENLEKRIRIIEKSKREIIRVNFLITKSLSESIDVVVETDADGYIARSVDFPLYGYGDDALEAIENLKSEIESTYNDLLEDNNFSDDWLAIKNFLIQRIAD